MAKKKAVKKVVKKAPKKVAKVTKKKVVKKTTPTKKTPVRKVAKKVAKKAAKKVTTSKTRTVKTNATPNWVAPLASTLGTIHAEVLILKELMTKGIKPALSSTSKATTSGAAKQVEIATKNKKVDKAAQNENDKMQNNLFDTAPAQETKEEKTAKAVTKEEITQALQSVAATQGMDKCTDILSQFDAQRISDIKEEDYADFIEACTDTAAPAVTQGESFF